MTAYTTGRKQTTSQKVQETRERRRKMLEAARRIRRANYRRFYRKMQEQSQATA